LFIGVILNLIQKNNANVAGVVVGKLTVLRELLDYEAGVLTAESKAVRESDVDF